MIRSMLAYLKALLREWVAFMMGSAALAIIGGIEHYRGQSIAWSLYVAAALCGFFVANYRVWAAERVVMLRAGPRLGLTFQPWGEPYVHDFIKFLEAGTQGPRLVRHRTFRVMIDNPGPGWVNGVRAVVDGVKPAPPSPVFPDEALRFCSGRTPPESLSPSSRIWAELVKVDMCAQPRLRVLYARGQRQRWSPLVNGTTLLIRLEGGSEPIYGRYRLTFDATGNAAMTAAE